MWLEVPRYYTPVAAFRQSDCPEVKKYPSSLSLGWDYSEECSAPVLSSPSVIELQLFIVADMRVCMHAQSCPILCSPPGSSVHGIFQARILECVTISSSKGFSQPRDRTRISCVSCIEVKLHKLKVQPSRRLPSLQTPAASLGILRPLSCLISWLQITMPSDSVIRQNN